MVQNMFMYDWEIRSWDFGCPQYYYSLQGQMEIALKVFLEHCN